ncbi:MAG: hypothetical protein GTO63_35880 [Anaerolineae bacterium]|nr:hypothetical protein [Anaerolineae bacterium]NIO00135.1 hypothetical protein [Anaerolineae bacterium]
MRVPEYHRARLILTVGALIFSGCAGLPLGSTAGPTAVPCDSEIAWEDAVALVHSGRVAGVYQLHSLDVTLVLDDGCTVHTVEPVIDDIFHEVERCGEPCADIRLATE